MSSKPTRQTETSKPAPLETGPGEQKDDNIDEFGRKPGGKAQDQPVKGGDKAGTGVEDR